MRALQALASIVRRWLLALDSEKISTFQTMYYYLFVLDALVLIAVPQANVAAIRNYLSTGTYVSWLYVNLLCPVLTLVGRKMFFTASLKEPDQPNFAYGAAILQLVGDAGVWACINIYVVAIIRAGVWLEELFSFVFLVMGVLGGGMFTVRSIRRLTGIERRSRNEGKGQNACQGTT